MSDQKNKISKKIFFAWPTRTIAYSIGSVLITYVTFFATDFMGIAPATAGIIFMLSKIFDGFTDIVAGYLIDATRSKWGKGRPYELALIGYWVFMVLIFCAPQMGITASCIYLFVMYTIVNSVFLTLLMCAEPVYLANALKDQGQSVSILAFTGFVSMIFTMVASMILPQMIKTIGTTRQGWMTISIILAVPCTVVGMIRFFVIKERKDINQAGVQKITIKSMLSVLAQNKYILIFSVAILTSCIGSSMVNGVQTYYFTYIMNDIGLASILQLSMLAVIVVIIVTPALSKKIGFVNVMRLTTLIGMAGYVIRLFAPRNMALLFVTNVLAMMGFYTLFAFVNTFVIDCMDYGEWKLGIRSEGTISCVQSVASKIGNAIGAGAIGLLMGLSGYDGSLAVQKDSANTMLIMLFTLIPAGFCLIQFLLLKVYDLDKMLPKIRSELEEKRASRQ